MVSSFFQVSNSRDRDLESPFSELSEPASDIDLDLEFSRLEESKASKNDKSGFAVDIAVPELNPNIRTAIASSAPKGDCDTHSADKKDDSAELVVDTNPMDTVEHASPKSLAPLPAKKKGRRAPSKTKVSSNSSVNTPVGAGTRRGQRTSRFTGSFKE